MQKYTLRSSINMLMPSNAERIKIIITFINEHGSAIVPEISHLRLRFITHFCLAVNNTAGNELSKVVWEILLRILVFKMHKKLR